MKKNVKLWAMIGLPFLLAGCTAGTEDLYNPSRAEELLKSEYSAKFIAKYGEIPADYSWDATLAAKYPSTRAGEQEGLIRNTEWYEVEKATLEGIKGTLIEKEDHRDLGEPFILTVPENEFTIVPIFQGESGMEWELWMEVGDDEPVRVWGKSEKMEYSLGDEIWKSVDALDKGTAQNTMKATGIRAIEYTYDYSKRAGEPIKFFLMITEGLNDPKSGYVYADTGTKQYSDKGMMLALTDCPIPANINKGDQNNKAMIIGCEDANLSASDWDMNDVVFLIYGNPEIPSLVNVISKRYMIEDLGATDDFDFNDIVVDVTQTTEIVTVVTEDGTKIPQEKVTQKAVLRHLGGTLPFNLKIGDTEFGLRDGEMRDLYEEHEIFGWDPKTNNISVKVRNLTGDQILVDFPEAGSVPMILAVDPDVMWMDERVPISREWFENLKNK